MIIDLSESAEIERMIKLLRRAESELATNRGDFDTESAVRYVLRNLLTWRDTAVVSSTR